ncbi:hypothetical protein GCM10011579_036470 [Streptomyces albiflavescens]|uniref:Uncharacterized protein n=1 Tax=Streptomyces albiflavescens TaxID=1623582 RepID=A0A917Y331_9ACTN|nr:hypothetical protein [Streptomyces albiflavescens]GGN65725.1 hypothetical protein GCM10011579_036470 [Streptomyces albiflavescens]
MSSASGTIVIHRGVEPEFIASAFKVRIDGVVAGRIRVGATVEFPVTPGTHQLQLTIAWYASLPLSVDVRPGERHELTAGIGAYLASFFRPKRYLVLTE